MLYSVMQCTDITEVFFTFKMALGFTVHVKMQFHSRSEEKCVFFCFVLHENQK